MHQWVKTHCPAAFFQATTTKSIGNRYGEVISWVGSQRRFRAEALAEFAAGADGWLIAYANENNLAVVTQETAAPESKTEVKIPDVCAAFHVPCVDTFQMLAALGVRFAWKP